MLSGRRNVLTLVLLTAIASAGVAAAPTEELFGAYNFLLEVAGSGQVAGAFREIDGLSVEQEVIEHAARKGSAAATPIPGPPKWANITLKRGVTHIPDLDAWKARVDEAGLLILTKREAGRVACRWEIRRAQVLSVSGATVRDAAELRLRGTIEGGCR
jgi:phage tail-like protein